MRSQLRSFVVSFLLMALVGEPTRSGEIPAYAKNLSSVQSEPPVFSFNGKNLSGFYTFTRYHQYEDPYRVFTVHDGMVHVSGQEPGGFATRDSFSNYHLIVEWKWGSATWHPRRFMARNSGIMVHCVGPDGDALASWMESIECQIIEGGTGDLIVVPGKGKPPSLTSEVRIGADGQPYYQKGGELKTLQRFRFNWWGRDPEWKDVQWFRGPNDVEKPVGQWNRMEVICDGDTITCLLNGVLVNASKNSSLTSGKILFQSEGAEIFFRKIEVRPLRK